MTTSTIIAIALLFIAIADTLLVRYVLPNMLAKNPNANPEKNKVVLQAVNAMTFLFAGAGVIVYLTQCFG